MKKIIEFMIGLIFLSALCAGILLAAYFMIKYNDMLTDDVNIKNESVSDL